MAPTAEAKPAEGEKTKKPGKPKNRDLGNGIYKFSRSRMYHKKAIYKFVGKKVAPKKKPVKPTFVEKPIGGEKNGGKRIVLLKKRRNYYPTQDKWVFFVDFDRERFIDGGVLGLSRGRPRSASNSISAL